MRAELDHRLLYRLPWSMTDNTIAWLEPTEKCNLSCYGCYRKNVNHHKSLKEISEDLDVFAKYRKFDSVSIAGGDPLTHPEVVDIVAMVAERGWKPTLNTNGLVLDEPLLRELKAAGLKAVTFHIDSRQGRPGWNNKTELETCELRLHYAEMVAKVGGILTSFNSTVYESTLDSVGDLVAWAQEHIDIVHTMVFIAYREAILGDQFDYYIDGDKVNPDKLVYTQDALRERIDIDAYDVVGKIRERYPDFAPCAYLNGSEKPDSFKWLLTTRFGNKQRIHGYMGPKAMELVQVGGHALDGRYSAYTTPEVSRSGRAILAGLAPFDESMRRAAKSAFTDPRTLVSRIHMQTIVVIQPIDILPDGRQNMCDSCPDITPHNGELVWSCRLEERLNYGAFMKSVPKKDAEVASAASDPGGSGATGAAASGSGREEVA